MILRYNYFLITSIFCVCFGIAHGMIVWPALPERTVHNSSERLYATWKEKPFGQWCRNFTLNIHNQCPEGSQLHEYVCCGPTGVECCFAIQRWIDMMSFPRIVLVLSSFAAVFAYHQYRELKCKTPTNTIRGGPDRAECHLELKAEETDPGRPVPSGLGCWREDHKGEEREYCDLVCPNSYTVWIAYIDQGHRACFNFITYQVEKRDNEYYMWRSGKCLNSTVNYRIGCKFDDPFESQFKTDNEVISHLRARARRV